MQNTPVVKLQVRLELENDKQLFETEAAKALMADPVRTGIRLVHNRAVVLGIDDPDTRV
jgi:hypothetical protein